ncbi:MAG: hypothetical protein ACJ0DE_01010 [Dehalococcoidia bacterium]|tara:strand:+ start:191 stop:484 length:294 start_codon:yes stop_codon:yes gene_type:complete
MILIAYSCTIEVQEPKVFSGYLIEVKFENSSNGILKLKSKDKTHNFKTSNLDIDFLTINHLKQHMLIGEPINISAYKAGNHWEIIKIYDLDGTVHIE